MKPDLNDTEQGASTLLRNIKARLPQLSALLEKVSSHWHGEDGFYRFYHQSFKVYHLQGDTLEAFFHARTMLEFVVRYGTELGEAPRTLPSGWAAVLYLYDLR